MASLLTILRDEDIDFGYGQGPQYQRAIAPRAQRSLSQTFDMLVDRQFRDWGVEDIGLEDDDDDDADDDAEDRDTRRYRPPRWTQLTRALAATTTIGFGAEDDEGDGYEYLSWLGDFIGKVERGVSDINSVALRVDVEDVIEVDDDVADAEKDSEETSCCPVCLETLKHIASESIAIRKTIVCSHLFCEPCLETWLANNRKCPVCMTELEV